MNMLAFTERPPMPVSLSRIRESPRDVKPGGFPLDAALQDQLKYVLQYAVLAPSTHNSQPWLFRVSDTSVFLYADRSRGLPAIDPEDRCMIMSCGAALHNLCRALEAVGFAYRVSKFPNLSEPDLLARIDVETRRTGNVDTAALETMLTRRTRAPETVLKAPPADSVEWFQKEVEQKGNVLSLFGENDLTVVLETIQENRDEMLLLAKEEAIWRHPNRIRSRDGIPGGAQISPSVFFGGAEGALFGVLSTHGDRVSSWLEGGMALERGLLEATRRKVAISLTSAPLHLRHVRNTLGAALSLPGTPQVFVRLARQGRESFTPTPRRPLVDVMMHPGFTG